MSLQIGQAYQVFHGLNGMPLDSGKIYVGVAGRNPITDPIKIYYDESFTKTAINPVTTINGYVSRNGTPTNIYANTDKCSLSVYEKNGKLVFSDLYFTGLGDSSQKKVVAANVIDASGNTQQEINDIAKVKTRSILDYNPDTTGTTASDVQYAKLLADCNDGDTIEIGYGTYIKNNLTISKEINVLQVGRLLLDGDSNNSVLFTQEPSYTLSASTSLIALPVAGDAKLSLTPPTGVNLSDYCFTLESTEILTNRLGFTDPYYKNEFGYFISSDGCLASSINIDYLDFSKLTIKLYKKQLKREVKNLIPSIKSGTFTGTNRSSLVRESGVNNTIYNNCGIDKTNAESNGEGWAINRSGLNTYNSPVTVKTNKLGGDSYPFIGFIHGHNTFNNPKIVLSDNGHYGRFFASRHGSEIVINGLAGSLDEHWGYKYSINDSTIYAQGAITFAGGTLKLNNVNRYAKNLGGVLISVRSDTPTAHGDLIIENSNISGGLLYSTRSSLETSKAVLRKCFDRIIIKNSTIDDYGYQAISLRGYESGTTYQNDTRAQTELIIDNVNYKRIADASDQYGLINNNILSGWNIFNKVTINNIKHSVVGTDTVTTLYYLFRYLQADYLQVFNVNEFSAIGLNIKSGQFFGGSIGNAKGGLDTLTVADNLDLFGVTINSDIRGMTLASSVIDKIGYVGCVFKSDIPLNPSNKSSIAFLRGNTYGTNVSSTLYSQDLDINDYVNPSRKKQLAGSRSFTSNVTIPANSKTAFYTIATVGSRAGDAVQIGCNQTLDGVIINSISSPDNNISFQFINLTSSSVTLAATTDSPLVVKARVSKI